MAERYFRPASNGEFRVCYRDANGAHGVPGIGASSIARTGWLGRGGARSFWRAPDPRPDEQRASRLGRASRSHIGLWEEFRQCPAVRWSGSIVADGLGAGFRHKPAATDHRATSGRRSQHRRLRSLRAACSDCSRTVHGPMSTAHSACGLRPASNTGTGCKGSGWPIPGPVTATNGSTRHSTAAMPLLPTRTLIAPRSRTARAIPCSSAIRARSTGTPTGRGAAALFRLTQPCASSDGRALPV